MKAFHSIRCRIILAALFPLAITPAVRAQISFDNSAGTLDFSTAANWSGDQLPSVGGLGNAFIGGFDVTDTGTLTTSGELQIGTDAAPYGTAGIPGGKASLTLNAGANLTIGANLVIGQGRGDTDNSGSLTVNTGATLTLSAANSRLFLGFYDNDTNSLTSGTLTVNGGTVSQPSGLTVIGGWDTNNADNYGRGNLVMQAGAMTVQSLTLGWHGGVGHVTMTGGQLSVTSGYFSMGLGYDSRHGSGVFDMSGGVFTVGGDFSVEESSDDATVSSAFNQTGGTVNLNGGQKVVGRSGKGTGSYALSGNAILNVGGSGDLQVAGLNTGSTGNITVADSAALNVAGIYALAIARSQSSTGTVTLTSGTISLSPTSTLGVWMGAGGLGTNGTFRLNGGTLTTPAITVDGGSGTKAFVFNGGKLLANRSFSVEAAPGFTASIENGGAVIDTGGFFVTFRAPLTAGQGAGGVTKLGAGVLTLSSVNTYVGDTVVQQGRLALGRPSVSPNSTLTLGTAANSGTELELDFVGTNVVKSFVMDGVAMPPGTYDAANCPTRIFGRGRVQVPSPYYTWAQAHGLDGTAGKENDYEADPDGDGVANGLEWILDGEPAVHDSAGVAPQPVIAGPSLQLTFNRNTDTEGQAQLFAQWGVDLSVWNDVSIGTASSGPDAHGVTVDVQSLNAQTDRVTVSVPLANEQGGKLFARLNSPLPPGVGANAYTGPPITLASLIADMTNYDTVAKWPCPEYLFIQNSSYDRATISPDLPGLFANNDFSQYIRTETNQGRTEQVMMDDDGPGCIVRFWLTTTSNKSGVIRIYLDGSTTPAITFPSYNLLSGTLNLPNPFVIAHPGFSVSGNGGSTMVLPIPFSQHCKVTWQEQGSGSRYYQIDYRKYAKGTPVQTFTTASLDAARPAMGRRGRSCSRPPITPDTAPQTVNTTIAPGMTAELNLPAGPAAVRFLQFQMTSSGGDAIDHALRSTVIQMNFDGEDTVWCPIGDFFGSGVGVNQLQSWYRTVNADGTMICRWTMPYATSGKITLKNVGTSPVTVSLAASTGAWAWDNHSMHFHTTWHYESGLLTPPARDWNYVDLAGRGVYVGDTLSLYNRVATWYGEGDEKIRVDGEALPSDIGTGTEDYYNYSFAPQGIMQTPFANQVRVDQVATQGHNVETRTRNLDGIPFRHSFNFDTELISWNPTQLIYAATTYWYAIPGGASNVDPDPGNAAAYIPTLADAQNPPAPFPGAIDAELATVTASSAGLVYETQNMQTFGLDTWSRDAQLLGRGTKVGDFVTLSIPAPDSAAAERDRQRNPRADFGILGFTINGQASAVSYDGYSSAVTHSEEINLGTFTPVDGKFEIKIQVTGTNPATTGNRYYFGIDYFKLQ